MTTAQQIADALAAAYATSRPAVTAAFQAALADQVELVHLPAQPQDGSMTDRCWSPRKQLRPSGSRPSSRTFGRW